jgi:hypothetical protein
MIKNLLASRRVVYLATWVLGALCLGLACASINQSIQTESRDPASVGSRCPKGSDLYSAECRIQEERQKQNESIEKSSDSAFDLRAHRE